MKWKINPIKTKKHKQRTICYVFGFFSFFFFFKQKFQQDAQSFICIAQIGWSAGCVRSFTHLPWALAISCGARIHTYKHHPNRKWKIATIKKPWSHKNIHTTNIQHCCYIGILIVVGSGDDDDGGGFVSTLHICANVCMCMSMQYVYISIVTCSNFDKITTYLLSCLICVNASNDCTYWDTAAATASIDSGSSIEGEKERRIWHTLAHI